MSRLRGYVVDLRCVPYLGILLVFLIPVISGCGQHRRGGALLSSSDWVPALAAVEKQTPEAKAALTTDVAQSHALEVNIYLDGSLSMKPFAGPQGVGGGKPGQPQARYPASAFYTMVQAFKGQGAVRDWYKWGNPQKNSSDEIMRMIGQTADDPATYTMVNNDYATVLDKLAATAFRETKEGKVYLVISDGVQSSKDLAKNGMGPAARSLQGWVQRGGAVEIRLFGAPYVGTYYPEGTRTAGAKAPEVHYDEARRPFMLMALLPDAGSIGDWQQLWNSSTLHALAEHHQLGATLLVPSPDAIGSGEVVPEEALPLAVVKKLGATKPNLWKVSSAPVGAPWHSVFEADVVPVYSTSKGGAFPLRFDLRLPSGESAPATEAELIRKWAPKLTIWQEKVAGAGWELFKPVPEPMLGEVERRLPISSAPAGAQASSAGARVVVQYSLPWYPRKPLLCSFTVQRQEVPRRTPADFSEWSTTEDQDPKNSGKTYQLNAFLEQIQRIQPNRVARHAGALLYLK